VSLVAPKIELRGARTESHEAKVASWREPVKSTVLGGALAAGCVVGALLLTELLDTVFPTPLFFAAIVISTWYGGGGSGLFAVILSSAILDYYFVPPIQGFAGKTLASSYIIQFLAPALVTCWFVKKRKDAELSLSRSRDELEARVEERTGELRQAYELLKDQIAERIRAEETIQKTQAELAHVARVTTLGELAASIAHEVNQPLMAVVLNGDACLEWLARAKPNLGEAREAVERIIAEGNRAAEIIRRIRALFQKSPLHRTPVDIDELIWEIMALTQKEMIRNGISWTAELSGGLPPVVGDRVQLQQVVLNLVLNGIEAMSTVAERPREFRIRTELETDTAGAGVLVTVRDSGRGLPAEGPDRVFGAFFTTKLEGLGMGLSISRTIVEAHGGKIWATSAPDGAIFRFRLPACGGAA
jgi:C4-dicarboxylate-specific signal transduction histidine kinase